jgi:3-deoxy-D-manno-octulosonate 8-phosphate phosphatase (KDO 8-P phosphatase)
MTDDTGRHPEPPAIDADLPELRISSEELARRCDAITWVLLDVDGVLTDGRLIYGPDGRLWKAFDVKDGQGIKLLQRAGIQVGLLTGRSDESVNRRAADLGIDLLFKGQTDKGAAFSEFLSRQNVAPEQVAYAGDDLPDQPVLERCGLSFAPADAIAEIRHQVAVLLGLPGGRGAVRQMADLLLSARSPAA